MNLYQRFKNSSVAYKNVFILLMTLLPFIIGMGISINRSSDLDYFGVAINISGSQRMRTMLISNFSQSLYIANEEGDTLLYAETHELLESEISIYKDYMAALVSGNTTFNISENKYDNIISKINELMPLFDVYVENAENLLDNPGDVLSKEYIVSNSLELKNRIHEVVGMFETQYESEVKVQRSLDYTIIIVSIIFTALGLLLTRRIRLNEKYATYDYLTGLKTRRVIFEDMKDENANDYSALFIDLDKFKYINDTFGHNVGDEILIEAAKRLNEIFSPDSVYRYGGDEFIVLRKKRSESEDKQFLNYIGELIKKIMGEPINDSSSREHIISFSLGIVTSNVNMSSFEDLIDFADDLMYDSKNFNSQIIICDSPDDAKYRKQLKSAIYDVFEKKQIEPFLQSIVDREGNILGYEALARWVYNGKVLSPISFLPILTRTGLIEDLDCYMIREVDKHYSQLKKMCYCDELSISVNISKESIYNINSNNLLQTLKLIKMPKQLMLLELSEEIAIDDFIVDKIRLIKELGFSIVLDDFSAGSTSIDSLRLDFIKRVKIDKSVVKTLSNDYSVTLLRELVYLMHSMGKKVLIEGVETEEQFKLLKALYVDYFQGYYFDHPKEMKQIDICNIMKKLVK